MANSSTVRVVLVKVSKHSERRHVLTYANPFIPVSATFLMTLTVHMNPTTTVTNERSNSTQRNTKQVFVFIVRKGLI